MKLLFDQNLSPKLASKLADVFPGSTHVLSLNLDQAEDGMLWDHATLNGFAIVSKDEDFSEMSLLRGFPPKVIWLEIGNCTTLEVEDIIRRHLREIVAFESDPNTGTLLLTHH